MTIRALLPEVGSEGVARNFTDTANEAREAVRGAAEERAVGPREGEGRAYMARLRDRQRASAAANKQAEFLQARVAHVLEGVAREGVCSPLTPGAQSLSVSHLVTREAVARYRRAVDSLVAGDPAVRLLVSGPWAPYSFARITDG